MSLITPFRHALPVSESLFHGALYLTHAGWERIECNASYPQNDVCVFSFEWEDGRTLPDFCLVLIVAGSGELQTRGHRAHVKTGDTFLLCPGEWHRHRPLPNTGWTILWIHFNGSETQRWMKDRAFNLRDNIAIIANRRLFRAQFEYLLECVHRNPSSNTAGLSRQAIGLLSYFVMDASGLAVGGADQVKYKLVNTVVERIWNFSHYQDMDVPFLAHEVGISRRTLDRHFKNTLGHSVLEEIQFCRISRAVRLLEMTTMPLKQVVYRAGFRNREQFRVIFQKTFGMSPEAYRKKSLLTAVHHPPLTPRAGRALWSQAHRLGTVK